MELISKGPSVKIGTYEVENEEAILEEVHIWAPVDPEHSSKEATAAKEVVEEEKNHPTLVSTDDHTVSPSKNRRTPR